MINRTLLTRDILNKLKHEALQKPDSFTAQIKLSTFLISQGWIQEALPHLMRIYELMGPKMETNIKRFNTTKMSTATIPDTRDALYRMIDQATAISLEEYNIYHENPTEKKPTRQTTQSIFLTRKMGENIMIGDDIQISIVDIECGSVQLKIDLPKKLQISQCDEFEDVLVQNKKAINTKIDKFRAITKDLKI